jgi:hypothetical protein
MKTLLIYFMAFALAKTWSMIWESICINRKLDVHTFISGILIGSVFIGTTVCDFYWEFMK